MASPISLPGRRLTFIAALAIPLTTARAQDSMHGAPEPIVASIDPARLAYDLLVDGDLPADDPAAKKFKTLQAAYAAAPEGTAEKPTVIGLKPNVYQLPATGSRRPSMDLRKNYITFLGLTNNRRAVVLADNRGLMQGADDNGYILDVNAVGFTLRNLTVINYVNADYEYPGDARKNLAKRSSVITQGVALQAQGDKHVYENVALLGRLDTIFLRTARSYFKNVYIEGTDDWMGGGQMSVWEDCTLVYPTGRGVMSASNIVFFNCRFEATRGMQFYKVEFGSAARPVVLIDCTFPVSTEQNRISWLRGKTPPRPNQYSLTYHNKDTAGGTGKLADSNVGVPTFTYSREMSATERAAYNSWNLLRAAPNAVPDDWDPAGVRAKFEAQGAAAFRMTLSGGAPTIRTGGSGATIGAAVVPARADQTITWSTPSKLVRLSRTTGPNVVVTATNDTQRAEWVPVHATAHNGYFVTAWVQAEPKFTAPPAIAKAPTLRPAARGTVSLDYTLELAGKEDQSLITWAICDDATGANARVVALSRGNEPLRSLPLTRGYVGKFLRASLQPKHNLSEPGPEVTTVSAQAVAAKDVSTTTESPNFRNFVTTANENYVSGLWSVFGNWTAVTDEKFPTGYGVRPPTTSGFLFYQNDADAGDMQVDLLMSPEKTEGTGFSVPGSPADTGERNLHADVYVKFDPRTRNGYALRFWRTTQSAAACMFQFYKIENGAGSPLGERQVLTGVFKPVTHLVVKAIGDRLIATATNDVDGETLNLECPMPGNRFGGAGVSWPRGSTNTYGRIEVSFPGH